MGQISVKIPGQFSAQINTHSAKWFATNPLMLVKLISYSGDMYENQFVYTLKIRMAVSSLLMLHALSSETGDEVERFHSSAHVNNFETLDIRHYLIGEAIPGQGRAISTRRVPMNVAPLELARLSDLAATISTKKLATSRMKRLEVRVTAALGVIERGYLRHVHLTTRSKAENRLYQRLVTALDWFRASFGSNKDEADAVVSLAVAFETLLTDCYKRGVADHIERRVGICLKGVPKVGSYKRSVKAIYYARSEIVHSGSLGQAVNLARARVAFSLCFCEVAQRLEKWTPVANEPIRDLLDD
ncbi:HEPN domain-containing protein [Sulfitobacter sp. NAS-14.1]|uniref:HEPN domain-containing protein n=1 Tax=Sulfitobacter sp. (strain NAS-14.1) TaxID=314267 RepID=UPI000323D42A|nr:HEPN domain-containing protein [Sulfitobacter sp. NAS-14.1]